MASVFKKLLFPEQTDEFKRLGSYGAHGDLSEHAKARIASRDRIKSISELLAGEASNDLVAAADKE